MTVGNRPAAGVRQRTKLNQLQFTVKDFPIVFQGYRTVKVLEDITIFLKIDFDFFSGFFMDRRQRVVPRGCEARARSATLASRAAGYARDNFGLKSIFVDDQRERLGRAGRAQLLSALLGLEQPELLLLQAIFDQKYFRHVSLASAHVTTAADADGIAAKRQGQNRTERLNLRTVVRWPRLPRGKGGPTGRGATAKWRGNRSAREGTRPPTVLPSSGPAPSSDSSAPFPLCPERGRHFDAPSRALERANRRRNTGTVPGGGTGTTPYWNESGRRQILWWSQNSKKYSNSTHPQIKLNNSYS
ncbi:unnamed protein product [Nesidiocoris tenuis]|uniref:Uncharacterized protein n=1 Tax=Nesidiocoris tenuis TaxID=355587 RepID=A0A6H5H774_9HEMI|nr:unnamed protein product [Nesidiocoris tenuis]